MGDPHRRGTVLGVFSLFFPLLVAVSPYPEALRLVPVVHRECAIKSRDQTEVLVPTVLVPHTIDMNHHEPLVIRVEVGIAPLSLGGRFAQADAVGGGLSRVDRQ